MTHPQTRSIRQVLKSKPTVEGAGVHLKRVFGFREVPRLDPFLLLDDFHSSRPEDYLKGFPWHPHRGIETITYLLEGEVAHGDSLGNKGTIHSGGVQWMTAGSGIVHQEMPKGQKDGSLWGFQLWANLPASKKMMAPRYRDIKKEQIPEVRLANGGLVRIICGEINGVEGPVRDIVIDPQYLDVTLPPHKDFRHTIKRGHRVFAYVIDGMAYFDESRECFSYGIEGDGYFDFTNDCLMGKENLIIYSDGDDVVITTVKSPVRFLLVSGKPLGEPVAWYGPIVMNTKEELKTAFDEYEAGTFIKHGN
jgi:redox-sensitive bicupin YhaK (pirin superfamily)